MSVDYNITIHRKADGKKIGNVHCNYLKTIFDSEFGLDRHDKSFETSTIENIIESAKNKIEDLHNKIFEKKLMIPMCQNVDIKHEIEEDIQYIEDEINEIYYVIYSCNKILGIIDCIVESNINEKDDMAYHYNAEGLPKEHDYEPSLWVGDIYCEIHNDWE